MCIRGGMYRKVQYTHVGKIASLCRYFYASWCLFPPESDWVIPLLSQPPHSAPSSWQAPTEVWQVSWHVGQTWSRQALICPRGPRKSAYLQSLYNCTVNKYQSKWNMITSLKNCASGISVRLSSADLKCTHLVTSFFRCKTWRKLVRS